MDGDTIEDFVMMDAIIHNEDRNAPSQDDIRRWAEGELPRYGINGWSTGYHEYPQFSDGSWDITGMWSPGSVSLPTNVIIGADFVVDYVEAGWRTSQQTAMRCCIEKNLCEGRDPSFVIPSTGTACDQTFDCRWTADGSTWIRVCVN